ncbi:MAG: methylglyoxal synthase, partial [Oceanospirillaceae bacterium]|nr:methylglyoxal synthase [Oceanospirillaceae bacterium]
MHTTQYSVPSRKSIALVAHDHRKADLADWCLRHRDRLAHHQLFATGTTGNKLAKALELPIT